MPCLTGRPPASKGMMGKDGSLVSLLQEEILKYKLYPSMLSWHQAESESLPELKPLLGFFSLSVLPSFLTEGRHASE